MVVIKTDSEIRKMRVACEIAATVLDMLSKKLTPGISTYEIDQLAADYIDSFGAKSACFNYKGSSNKRFPSYMCISVNEEIVHGIGRKDKILKNGDVVSLDVALVKDGFIGDNASTYIVGDVNPDVQQLLDVTKRALEKGIEQAIPGNYVGDISYAIENYVNRYSYGIVKEFAGHGVGRSMHEDPQIPNYGRPGTGCRLKPGMTIAIEPMINLGGSAIEFLSDGWTAITSDRKVSAHFEHTVLITSDNAEILTLSKLTDNKHEMTTSIKK